MAYNPAMQGDYEPTMAAVLRAILDFEGIDAEGLARRMKRSPQVIRRWTRGDAVPTIANMDALAQALDAPVELFVRPPASRNAVFAAMLAHRAVEEVERS